MHFNLHDRMKAMRADRLCPPALPPFSKDNIAFAKVDSETKRVIYKSHSDMAAASAMTTNGGLRHEQENNDQSMDSSDFTGDPGRRHERVRDGRENELEGRGAAA
jgi:hypothetical protein